MRQLYACYQTHQLSFRASEQGRASERIIYNFDQNIIELRLALLQLNPKGVDWKQELEVMDKITRIVRKVAVEPTPKRVVKNRSDKS